MKGLAYLIAVVMIVVVFAAGCTNNNTYDKHQFIYNLDNPASMVSGHFVLGSGYVETHLVYLYYIENARGNYELKWVDAAVTEIAMDEEDNPYIITTIEQRCNTDCFDPGSGTYSERYPGSGTYSERCCYDMWTEHAVIHVPKGTITQAYSLGAK